MDLIQSVEPTFVPPPSGVRVYDRYFITMLRTDAPDPNGPIQAIAVLRKVGQDYPGGPYLSSPVDPDVTFNHADLRIDMARRLTLYTLIQQINHELQALAQEDGLINLPAPSGAGPSGIAPSGVVPASGQ